MRVPKMVKNGFNSVLQTSAVREGWLPQGIHEQMRSPKLSPNHKRRIKTILDQFGNKHTRVKTPKLGYLGLWREVLQPDHGGL